MIVSFLVLKPSLIMSKNDNLINCILNQLVESWFQSILSYLKVVLNQISCLKLKVIDLICTTQFHLVPPSIGVYSTRQYAHQYILVNLQQNFIQIKSVQILIDELFHRGKEKQERIPNFQEDGLDR